jgi:hypothetical protein
VNMTKRNISVAGPVNKTKRNISVVGPANPTDREIYPELTQQIQ